MLTVTDLFAGAGGSSEGLTQAGMKVVIAANHWQTAIDTHSANHTGTEHRIANLAETDWTTFPTTDVLWASPSCVWHSRSGGRKAEPEDLERARASAGAIDRATAFAVIEATEVHRYPVVLVENVAEFRGWVLHEQWLAMMGVLGYVYQELMLNAADFGAAQSRTRLFYAFTRAPMALLPPALSAAPASTILEDLPMRRMERPMYITPQVDQITAHGVPHLVMMRRNAKPKRADRHPLATITASGVHHYLAERTTSGDWYRRLTNRELARGQGFPDTYEFTGSRADVTRQIGNAVPVQVARWFGDEVTAHLSEVAA